MASSESGRFALRAAAALTLLLVAPVVAYVALDFWSATRCASVTTAEGRLDGAIHWRIARLDCEGASAPYYDVSIGAEGHALATAATSRGAPVPLAVRRLAEDRFGVELDRPSRDGSTVVSLRLRRTGGPAERVDLGAEAAW